jgi:hypothetical protein
MRQRRAIASRLRRGVFPPPAPPAIAVISPQADVVIPHRQKICRFRFWRHLQRDSARKDARRVQVLCER